MHSCRILPLISLMRLRASRKYSGLTSLQPQQDPGDQAVTFSSHFLNHRMVEVGRDFWRPSGARATQSQLPTAMPRWLLNISKDGFCTVLTLSPVTSTKSCTAWLLVCFCTSVLDRNCCKSCATPNPDTNLVITWWKLVWTSSTQECLWHH